MGRAFVGNGRWRKYNDEPVNSIKNGPICHNSASGYEPAMLLESQVRVQKPSEMNG